MSESEKKTEERPQRLSPTVRSALLATLLNAVLLGCVYLAVKPDNPHNHWGTDLHWDCGTCGVALSKLAATKVAQAVAADLNKRVNKAVAKSLATRPWLAKPPEGPPKPKKVEATK